MRWSGLRPGDVVIPAGKASPWLLLSDDDDGPNLNNTFDPTAKVLRGGEDVNKP